MITESVLLLAQPPNINIIIKTRGIEIKKEIILVEIIMKPPFA